MNKEIIYEVKCYDFVDLDLKIQEKVKNRIKDDLREVYCDIYLKDDMQFEAERLLENVEGLTITSEVKVCCCLDYSQSNYASLECNIEYNGHEYSIKGSDSVYQRSNYITDITYNHTLDDDGVYEEQHVEELQSIITNCNNQLLKYGYDMLERASDAQEVEDEIDLYYFDDEGKEYIKSECKITYAKEGVL